MFGSSASVWTSEFSSSLISGTYYRVTSGRESPTQATKVKLIVPSVIMVRIKGHNPYKTTFEIRKWAVNKLDLFFFFWYQHLITPKEQLWEDHFSLWTCSFKDWFEDWAWQRVWNASLLAVSSSSLSAVVWVDFKLVLSMLHWLLLWFHWINLHRKTWGWIRWVKLREECSCINLIAVSSEIKILNTELSPPYPYAESYFVVSQITFF